MKRWFVVPDLHGNARLAQRLLETAGVPLFPVARKEAGIVSVQLGDLVNCVARDRDADLETLAFAGTAFDVVLVGNHEFPYFGGRPFSGFSPFAEIRDGLHALERRGILQPCLLPWPANVLLTHAGVAPQWGFTMAVDAANAIDAAWTAGPDGLAWALLAQVGRARGGIAPYGGVLWSDWGEPRAPFGQIHGHTPIRHGPLGRGRPTTDSPRVLNLDVGVGKGADRIVGVWLNGDGNNELVEYRSDGQRPE